MNREVTIEKHRSIRLHYGLTCYELRMLHAPDSPKTRPEIRERYGDLLEIRDLFAEGLVLQIHHDVAKALLPFIQEFVDTGRIASLEPLEQQLEQQRVKSAAGQVSLAKACRGLEEYLRYNDPDWLVGVVPCGDAICVDVRKELPVSTLPKAWCDRPVVRRIVTAGTGTVLVVERPPLEDAVKSFVAHYGRPHWLTSVGAGEDDIKVLLKTEQHPELPKAWEHWPLDCVVVGEMRMCGASSPWTE